MKKKESEDKTKAKLDELSAENSVIQKKKLECELKLESEREKYAAQEMDLGSQKLAIDQLKEEEKKYVKEIKGLENLKKTVEGEIRIFEEQISSLNSASSARERKQREKQRPKKRELRTTSKGKRAKGKEQTKEQGKRAKGNE